MKNKKAHSIVLIISYTLIICIIGLIVFGYIMKYEKISLGSIILDILLILWLGTYPISFYTFWRLLVDEEANYNGIVSHMIYSSRGNKLNIIWVTPLIFSPFFLALYIKVFKNDRNIVNYF
ncbi:MAG: hypothetical protein ACI35W_00155 [Anaeroplasmataceae bacterium]